MTFTAIDTLRHTWPNYQKKYIKDTVLCIKVCFKLLRPLLVLFTDLK